jgi:hypothetical protein
MHISGLLGINISVMATHDAASDPGLRRPIVAAMREIDVRERRCALVEVPIGGKQYSQTNEVSPGRTTVYERTARRLRG